MKRHIVAITLAALCLAGTRADAQGIRYGLGGTGQFSLEEGGGSDFGFGAIVDFIPVGHLGFRLDGSYLFNEGDDYFLLNGDAAYHFSTASRTLHPYLLGGASLLGFDETEFGVNVGAGANFHRPGGSVGFFADARFNHFFDNSVSGLQIMAGVRFGEE
ncbi:MAG TPA: hypothetical protein VFU00_02785 [Gemmatimonadales bacterium]|nr:hypothetical protein [Gemmatimonadales bacterium]